MVRAAGVAGGTNQQRAGGGAARREGGTGLAPGASPGATREERPPREIEVPGPRSGRRCCQCRPRGRRPGGGGRPAACSALGTRPPPGPGPFGAAPGSRRPLLQSHREAAGVTEPGVQAAQRKFAASPRGSHMRVDSVRPAAALPAAPAPAPAAPSGAGGPALPPTPAAAPVPGPGAAPRVRLAMWD
ncbi:transcription initiation factor TFIID subunit 4-like [Neopelma chrysocephalum]|uniref:transcription initiation factor TFIID subunit 4-like n=1 Tax=Neopelma chrysocephalum TaxID=114329 RepID=UPI000FCCF2E2|nr:transcription initiation factor TFIID subunit 4-like [Neopelma chrysocephalum]